MTYAQDVEVLREAMRTKEPAEVVSLAVEVALRHHLDKPCPVCAVKPGVMCRTIDGELRSVIHEERRHA